MNLYKILCLVSIMSFGNSAASEPEAAPDLSKPPSSVNEIKPISNIKPADEKVYDPNSFQNQVEEWATVAFMQ